MFSPTKAKMNVSFEIPEKDDHDVKKFVDTKFGFLTASQKDQLIKQGFAVDPVTGKKIAELPPAMFQSLSSVEQSPGTQGFWSGASGVPHVKEEQPSFKSNVFSPSFAPDAPEAMMIVSPRTGS